MKGFIEVEVGQSSKGDQKSFNTKTLIPISEILRIIPNNDRSIIITKELVSRYECSNDNLELYVKKSYEEIKELIKNAQ